MTDPVEGSIEPRKPEPVEESLGTVLSEGILPTSASCGGSEQGGCRPIAHWASTGRWPENFSTMDPESDSSKKREYSSSYTAQSKNGDVPKADTPAFEKKLGKHGIVMNEVEGDMFVSAASKELCAKMLESRFDDPEYTQFPL